MINTALYLSENHNPNYVATVCRVGEVHPISGADRLVETTINGFRLVVGKETKEGDIVIYFPVECCLDHVFLAVNDLYNYDNCDLNCNYQSLRSLVAWRDEAKREGNMEMYNDMNSRIKSECGMFRKDGRVRIVKLRGIYSQGFICKPEFVERWAKIVGKWTDIVWEDHVGETFDVVMTDTGNRKLVEKYQVEVPVQEDYIPGQKRWRKTMKRLLSYDCMVPGQFRFHYDTIQAEFGLNDIQPDSVINLSVKVDGSSVILANVLTKFKPNIFQKVLVKFGKKYPDTVYRTIYSSRRRIKNRWVSGRSNNYYAKDIHGFVYRDFKDSLAPGMTVYGEIVGYQEGTNQFIQSNHDYGCEVGKWKFMPYRITNTNEDGEVSEWNFDQVLEWARNMSHTPLRDKILVPEVVYHGKAKDLYPDIPIDKNWGENFVVRLHSDKSFYMELDEPLCKCNVPREGLVLRIDNDIMARAWKIKTARHLAKEGKDRDEGKVNIEEIS